VVVDLDGETGLKSAQKLFSAHGGVPKTFTVETGGGGLHLYFQAPESVTIRNSASKLAPGVDIRASGGYVVGPGSRHPSGGRYILRRADPPAALPSWLLEVLSSPQSASLLGNVAADVADRLRTDADAGRKALAVAERAIGRAATGGRNAELNSRTYQITSRFGHALDLDEIRSVMLEAAKVARLGEDEARATIESAVRAGAEASEVRRGGWRSQLSWNASGTEPLSSTANCMTTAAYHEDLRGLVRYNELKRRVQFIAPPPWDPNSTDRYPRDMADRDAGAATQWFRNAMRMNLVSAPAAHDALTHAAYADRFDPFKEYLEGLTWDGVARLDTWLVTYAGAEDSPFVGAAFSKWLISAVARTYQPGCQADHVLVLDGDQGVRKTTFFAALGGPFFTSDLGDITNKDSVAQLEGFVIIEFGEIDHLSKKAVEDVKAYLTRRVDNVRPAYGRLPVATPRRCVFAGTTNRDEYFMDASGARRFWPVKVQGGPEFAEATVKWRGQLWAEAYARYQEGETWWLEEGTLEYADAADAQEQRRIPHPWESQLLRALHELDVYCRTTEHPEKPRAGLLPQVQVHEWQLAAKGVVDCLTREQAWEMLGVRSANHADTIHLSGVFKALGWEKVRRMVEGERHVVYLRPERRK
jgi:predicted P-loop ATPase